MQFSFPFIFLLFSSPFVAQLADGSGGKRQRKTQIYPQEMAVDGEDGDGIYDDAAYGNLDQMFDEDAVDVYPSLEGKGGKRQKTSSGRSNNNALDDFSYLDDLDTTGGGGGGGGGVGGDQQQLQEPSAAFWRNAIGPFIYTFESVDRRRTRQLWLPVLRQLNLLRAKLGTAFTVRRLIWDDELARSLGQKEFTKTAPLYVPMARPMGGLVQNLRLGMQMLFQAMVHRRYIRCEPTRNGNCRGKRDRQFRLPIELVDSKAQRIGCVARLFKQRAKRNLLFGALCTTDRSVSQARHKLVLFSLDQLRNNALKRKLLRDAKNFEDEYEDDDDYENDDDDDDDDNEDYDDDDNGLQGKKGRVNEYDDYDADDDDRQAGTKVKAVEGDLLQAKADAIVNPTQPSLATGPLGGDEAGAQVLAAKSLFDVVDLQEDGESADGGGGGGGGAMEKRRVRKKLKALADMLDPERNGAIKDKAKAAQALQKVQQWQAQVADPTKWAMLEQEALKRIANGQQQQKNGGGGGGGRETLADRIVREGGKVLAQKLKQLAQARAGLPVGDAVATESFQIGVNFFAKKIIHTVPPSVLQTQRDKEKLAECYKRTLQVAVDEGVHKIAFPEMLPAGTDENSRREAIKIGLDTIKKWLIKHSQGKAQQLKTISFWLDKGQQQMLAFLREEIKKTFADGIQQQLTGGSKNRI